MKKVLVWETLALVSGGQRMTLNVLNMLQDEYSFHCLIPAKGALSNELEAQNIPYTLLGDQTMPTGVKSNSVIFKYLWLSIKAIVKALRVIHKEKPDLIYAPGPAALPWSAICGFLKRKPVLWHLHHIFLDNATKNLLNICIRIKSVIRVVAVSNVVGKQISNEKGLCKLSTIYNPVDFEKYSGGDRMRIIHEFPFIQQDTIIIGHIALLQASKRQDIVIETIKLLRDKGIDAHALLIGSTREEDAYYEKEVKKMINDNHLDEFIHFLGQRRDVPDILKTIDVLMIPSSEGFPLAGLEACAAGVPIAAANIGGSHEFVEISDSGLCFDYENAENAASIILKLLEPQNRKIFIENGIKFSKKHNLQSYKRKIKSMFDNVLWQM